LCPALLSADDFDQTPAFDPTDPEPVPEFDLDQTSIGPRWA
jgi:hypothetical protein